MNFIEPIGILAAALTTTAFFPQVIKTVRTKSTADISLPMYTMMVSGTICWLIYGILIKDLPIMLANGVSSLASFTIFYYKFREVKAGKQS